MAWAPPLAWAGAIFWASSGPGPDLPGMELASDKLLHAGVYAVLAFLLLRALRIEGVRPGKAAITAFLLATVYGMTDEWRQSFVPSRHAEILDVAADAAGASLVLLVPRRRSSSKGWRAGSSPSDPGEPRP